MDTIENIKEILSRYSNIERLLNAKDIEWLNNKLKMIDNPFTDKVNFNQFNLLTSIASENIFVPSQKLLTLLNNYLGLFPILLESSEFKRNIKSFDNYAFFSYLTELSFASFLHYNNFSIDFNTKYIKEHYGEIIDRDIDIETTSSQGEKMFFEIYTPNSEVEVNGFLDMDEFGTSFQKKISTKEFKKFENIKENQLFGKIFLAVNFIYDPKAQLYLTAKASDLYHKLENEIHKEVDGIIIFSHDLAEDNTLTINRFIKKSG
jgi:hypothetical protein